MIIGDGLIANAFKQGTFNHEIFIVFASGVSNSKEERLEEYDRELELLIDITLKNQEKKLVYFSSCNIDSDSKSTYLENKKKIENYIKTNIKDYLILRLPNVVGSSTNKNQLVNYFFYSLLEQKELTLEVDYIRHLLDVEDLPKIVNLLTMLQVEPAVLNIAFNNGINVKDIIRILETVVGKRFKVIKEVSNGNDYTVNNEIFLRYLSDSGTFNVEPENIIKKYFNKNKIV